MADKKKRTPKKPSAKTGGRDPGLPRRPPSGYIAYSNDSRAEVLSELGDGATIGEIGKELGRRWRELEPEPKLRYQNAAKKAMEKYKREMEAYVDKHGPVRKQKTRSDKAKHRAPVHNPYIAFCKKHRPSLPDGMTAPEKFRELGRMWGELSAEQKAKY